MFPQIVSIETVSYRPRSVLCVEIILTKLLLYSKKFFFMYPVEVSSHIPLCELLPISKLIFISFPKWNYDPSRFSTSISKHDESNIIRISLFVQFLFQLFSLDFFTSYQNTKYKYVIREYQKKISKMYKQSICIT